MIPGYQDGNSGTQVAKGLTVWEGSLQAMLLGYTLGPYVDSDPWFSPIIHFFDVYCMKFRINQNSGATPRRIDSLESFLTNIHLLILFSLHSP